VRLRFAYADRAGVASDRRVEPYRLVHLGRRWYLLAYDMDREAWRTFRVDRLDDPQPARNAFAPRPLPADDVGAYVRAQIEKLQPTIDVEVVVHAEAERLRRAIGSWGTLAEDGPGRCRVHLTSESLDWVVLVLSSVCAEVEVVRPPELVDHLHACAARFARARLID
jgi:predicted DNA-binding transcriptional regulator YafY